jgi:hypothetical protein
MTKCTVLVLDLPRLSQPTSGGDTGKLSTAIHTNFLNQSFRPHFVVNERLDVGDVEYAHYGTRLFHFGDTVTLYVRE